MGHFHRRTLLKFKFSIFFGWISYFYLGLINVASAESLLERILQKGPIDGPDWIQELSKRSPIKLAVQVARGRSTQGPLTDEKNPRLLVVFESPGESKEVYLGINRLSGETEVIEWNSDTGAYDFKIIENIRAASPRIKNNVKESCIPCHQHEGPIFPAPPWVGMEPLVSVFSRPNERGEKKETKIDSYGEIQRVAQNFSGSLKGGLFRFADQVEEAANKPIFYQACKSVFRKMPFDLKLKLLRYVLYQAYARALLQQKYNGQMPDASTMDSLRKEIEATQLSPLSSEEDTIIQKLILNEKVKFGTSRYASPFFPDHAVFNSESEWVLLPDGKKYPPAIVAKTPAHSKSSPKQASVISLHDLLPNQVTNTDKSDMLLTDSPEIVKLSQPMTKRPLESAVFRRNTLDDIGYCVRGNIDGFEYRILKEFEPRLFEEFLLSEKFTNLLKEENIPSSEIVQSHFMLFKKIPKHKAEVIATCPPESSTNSIDSITPIITKLPKEQLNMGRKILWNKCQICHKAGGIAQSYLFLSNQKELLPGTYNQVKKSIITGMMKGRKLPTLTAEETEHILRYIELFHSSEKDAKNLGSTQ